MRSGCEMRQLDEATEVESAHPFTVFTDVCLVTVSCVGRGAPVMMNWHSKSENKSVGALALGGGDRPHAPDKALD